MNYSTEAMQFNNKSKQIICGGDDGQIGIFCLEGEDTTSDILIIVYVQHVIV